MKFTSIVACSLGFFAAQNVAGQTAAPTTPAAPAPSTAPAADLPTFTYTLVSLPAGERENLCNQNKGFCVSTCGAGAPPMNFCNSTTMAWGCGCIDKVPNFQGYEWPINFAHCQGSNAACQAACGAGNNACAAACLKTWGSTCGTASQPAAYYRTEDIAQVPTYTGPAAASGSANSTAPSTSAKPNTTTTTATATNKANSANSGLAFSFGSAISALAVVAAGMMML